MKSKEPAPLDPEEEDDFLFVDLLQFLLGIFLFVLMVCAGVLAIGGTVWLMQRMHG